MPSKTRNLSTNSVTVLREIARGRTYEQILSGRSTLTYLDIFTAAREALALAGKEREDYAARLARIRQRHPRAYERWTADDDAQLKRAADAGTPVTKIAKQLQRQAGAIRSRLAKLVRENDEAGPI